MDSSTDACNVDNELFLAVWFDKEGVGEKCALMLVTSK